ncbi:MAG TPA: MEKHLA domain-containing protein, partial [Afipia sp.]
MTSQPDEISDDRHAELFGLITSSFERLIGKPLAGKGQGAQWLYREAPFAVLAHDGGNDPRFIYANHTAQTCFEYSWGELIGLPSRLSAEAPERAERQRLLDAVARDGFISNYKGVRISKSG